MFYPRLFLCLLLAAPVVAPAADTVGVARILNGKSFVLASGDEVRLASIEAPNTQEQAEGQHAARPGEPLGDEAKAALAALLAGHTVRIDTNPGTRDRHNRLLGQVYDEKGTWIQGEMLKRGWAMVYSFSDDKHEIIEKMLGLEREAQAAKRGIWANPYFRVISPAEAAEFVNRFKLVEGRVVSVHDYHGNTYINFFDRWKGNFAVFISHKHADAFAPMNLPLLVGKTIRVRGWINYHNAPMIDLTHPEQIEVE
jgi:endonuclease YncB( thermonuclease family)